VSALTYSEALSFVEDRGLGIKPGLERMQALAELLDDPQLGYPTIHVAGTNGKSSTAIMTATILASQGNKTGLYTSPHLQSLRERFTLMGLSEGALTKDEIFPSQFAGLLEYLRPFVELVEGRRAEQVTYFEMLTAAAFEWMSEKTVGAGVFEAGMGGRWDATNLVSSTVAVLTHIGVDHREFLGSTPLENAAEKAGVIKPGATVVSAPQEAAVSQLIKQTAEDQGARLLVADEDFAILSDEPAVGGRLVSLQGVLGKYEDLFMPLFGAHQTRNLALAVVAAESFLEQELHYESLANAVGALMSPGRLEVVRKRPLVILDGAHNPDGARALASAVKESFGVGLGGLSSAALKTRKVTAVISIFEDKDAAGILEFVVPLADKIIFTKSSSPRSLDPAALAGMAADREYEVIEPLPAAIDAAIASSTEVDLVLVTGSLFGVGEARDHLVGPIS